MIFSKGEAKLLIIIEEEEIADITKFQAGF
jgi:hypothetical protein